MNKKAVIISGNLAQDHEFIYPLINKIQSINDNLYRSLKEFTGYILINKNLIFTK